MLDFGKIVLGLFSFFIFFAAILFLAYVSTKFLGTKMSRGMRGRHLKIVETITLGFDRQIYLMKVGEQLLLVASSNKNIHFLTTLDSNLVTLTEEDLKQIDKEQQMGMDNVFKNYLEMFKGLYKKNEDTVSEENPSTEVNKFDHNLHKLKNIFSKINSQKNGDEKPNE